MLNNTTGGIFVKKLLLILTVCLTLTSCSSAGTKADSNVSVVAENTTSEVTPEEIKSELLQRTDCYKKESFKLPDNLKSISITYKLDDGSIIIMGNDESYQNTLLYRTDSSFSSFMPLTYEKPEEMQNFDFAYDTVIFNGDGSFNTIVTLEDHGGLVVPDEYDENFDYDAYNENRVTTYMIFNYDSSGKILNKAVINYPEELFDEYGYLISGTLVSDGDSLIQPFEDGSIRRISPEGEVITLYTLPNPDDYLFTTSPNMYKDRDGKTMCMRSEMVTSYDSNGFEAYETTINFYDFTDNGLSETPFYSCSDSNIASSIVYGFGEYRILIPTYDGLIGIKDDSSDETLIDWNLSGLEPTQVIPIEDNNFIGIDWNNSKDTAVKLSPRDMNELANTQIITATNFTDQSIINDFNNSQTAYRVETIEYSYEDNSALNMDIIQGNAPDIICGLDYSTYLNYRNKGVFADLYQLMDDELNENMIMPNILTALENNNQLFGLCTQFNLSTLAAKTKFCDKENWTFDDMLALYDNAPESVNHLYDGDSKEDMFNNLFCFMNDLIDYDNASCDFNNPKFIQMLEFCNRFVDTVDAPEKWDDYEAWDNYRMEKYYWFGNDQKFVEPIQFYNITEYNLFKYCQSNGEDITLVGYPSDNGKGGRIEPYDYSLISINQNCENKQGAWEFLKFYILKSNEVPDNAGADFYYTGIPILYDSLQKILDIEMLKEHSASGMKYPAYTQQESDMIFEYILSCDAIGTVVDDDITAICTEEAGLYFAGEQSAETAAEHIQNRASILISEKN